MAYSYALATGNGTTTQFAVPFSYLNQTDVTVLVNGVSTSFTWVNTGTVSVTPAPASGAVIRIKRSTTTTAEAGFSNATALNGTDLNNNQTQAIYLAEEALDAALDDIRPNLDNTAYDAAGKRILNVGVPTQSSDAVTKGYTDTLLSARVTLPFLGVPRVTDYGADPTGVLDSGPAFQSAYNANVGPVFVPPGTYWINTAVVCGTHPPNFIGAGHSEGRLAGTEYGTWLRITSTSIAPFTINCSQGGCGGFHGFAVSQDQGPIPTANGWTPGNYQPVWSVVNTGSRVDFEDIHLYNVSRGIYVNNGGRQHYRRITGEPLIYGIMIDTAYDVSFMDDIDFYTYWSGGTTSTPDTNVWNYKTANACAIILNRCDGCLIGNAFVLGYFAGIQGGSNVNGSTTGLEAANVYFDCCTNGIWVTSTDGSFRGKIGHAYLSGVNGIVPNTSIAGSHGIAMAGKGYLHIESLETLALGSSPVWLGSATGGGNVYIGSALFSLWNQDNTSQPCFAAANSGGSGVLNTITMATPPVIGAGNGGPVFTAVTDALFTIPGWTGAPTNFGSPATFPTVDASQSTLIVSQGTPLAIMKSSGIVIINEPVSGQSGIYITGGGAAALLGQSGTIFVNGASPASGQVSLYYDGAAATYKINCNIGAAGHANNLTVMNLCTRRFP